MRHSVFGKKLSQDTNRRKSLLNNLASSLIIKGELTTTLAKAKFAKSHVEKLVSVAKKDKLHKNRILASKLSNSAFAKLINEIGPGFKQRSGGFTKITKLAPRRGDAALMAKLEFLEWDKTQTKASEAKADKKPATSERTEKRRETTESKSVRSSKSSVSSAAARKRESPKVQKKRVKHRKLN